MDISGTLSITDQHRKAM